MNFLFYSASKELNQDSLPSFGIFRLTDPPEPQAVIDCQITEEPHPNPHVPPDLVCPPAMP